jgi:hypothetical protein
MRLARALGTGTLVLLLAIGCVDQNVPADCGDASVARELTLTGVELGGDRPSVCRGQVVTLGFTADGDGVLHIHGYDEQVPAIQYRADERIELRFTASVSGQFPIEIHTDEDPEGQEIGIFTVHER